jgi:nitrate/nitrite-specific signal transduction histidine kinase
MSKYIKLNQNKPDSETRTELYDDLEKSIIEKEKAIDQQKEQLDDMQELDQAKSEDNIYKISLDILNKSNKKLAFNSGTIEVAKHFPQKEYKSKFIKVSGAYEDFAGGLGDLYDENAPTCESCGDLANPEGICENPECENFNIMGDEHAYILDKRNKYPQNEFNVDELDPYSDK